MDAGLWLLVPTVLLLGVGVGLVSGDAVKHANRFAGEVLLLNPNHLLMEPVAKAWFDLTESLGLQAVGPDRLKYLDIIVGSLSLGLFRLLVPPRFGVSRLRANIATGVLAGGFAFGSLWISGEPIILQLPALVAAAYFLTVYTRNTSLRSATFSGLCFGLATLFFISNGVIFLTVVVVVGAWRWGRVGGGRWAREVAVLLGSWSAVCLTGFVVGWLTSSPDQSLINWIVLYKGDIPASETAYGLFPFSIEKLVVASARAAYGSVMALVDISSVVDAYRQGTVGLSHGLTVIVALVAVIAVGLLLRRLATSDGWPRNILGPITGWILGVLAFGVYFNNSDDQFFVQLSVPIAVLATAAPSFRKRWRSRLLAVCCVAVLAWNVLYLWRTQIAYPRDERLNDLAASVTGADHVIYPGHDEPGWLFHLLPDSLYGQRLSFMQFGEATPPEDAIASLRDTLATLVHSGSDVRVISVFEAKQGTQPWQLLAELGLPLNEVAASLREFRPTRVTDQGNYFDSYRLARPDSSSGGD